MILIQARILLEIGDTMRGLFCLLLVWSALLNDAKAQTAKESQAAAVAAIKKLGGKVTFDEENPDKPLIGVDLSNSRTTDAGLMHLKGLTSLQSLGLNGTKVTDVGLEHLKGLTSLQLLNLGDTQVTDAGLEHLKGLTNLQTLDLGGTSVTTAGVKDLQAALPKCKIFK
jgi:hypothetical protein